MKKSLLATALIATTLTLNGCMTIAEYTGDNTAALEKEAQEYQAKKQRAVQHIPSTDPQYQRINRILTKIIAAAKADSVYSARAKAVPNWRLFYEVNNTLNANATADGTVTVYTGLVNNLKLTDDELAAIMGHEIVHILEEHIKQQRGMETATSLLTLAVAYAGVPDAGIVAAVYGGEYGGNLPFSRKLETRADAGGIRLMAQAGYNPYAAVSFWNKMTNYQKANNIKKNLTIFSTHPSHKQRIEEMKKLAEQYAPSTQIKK